MDLAYCNVAMVWMITSARGPEQFKGAQNLSLVKNHLFLPLMNFSCMRVFASCSDMSTESGLQTSGQVHLKTC